MKQQLECVSLNLSYKQRRIISEWSRVAMHQRPVNYVFGCYTRKEKFYSNSLTINQVSNRNAIHYLEYNLVLPPLRRETLLCVCLSEYRPINLSFVKLSLTASLFVHNFKPKLHSVHIIFYVLPFDDV